MAGFSTSLANAIINATLRGQAFPAIRTTYFALFTADPTDAFTAGTEVAAAWYQRQPTGAFAAPANGVSYNGVNVEFPPCHRLARDCDAHRHRGRLQPNRSNRDSAVQRSTTSSQDTDGERHLCRSQPGRIR